MEEHPEDAEDCLEGEAPVGYQAVRDNSVGMLAGTLHPEDPYL